jgi:nucleoside 2-deoxyribosyltransferase
MKIVICGSCAFRKEMVEYRDRLNKMGHSAIISPVMEELALGKNEALMKLIETDHARAKKEGGYIKWYYNAIVNSDAILVLNLDKKGVKNYIGGNTLMEMGFAHVNDKKIFLLNQVPDLSYKEEINAMLTKILDGDLDAIEGDEK